MPAPKSSPMPGGITVTRKALYAHDPTLDARVIARIEAWRDSVPAGTATTVDKLLNCSPTCGCPKGEGPMSPITSTCTGNRSHGLALEVVMDHLNPPGSVCAIPGITLLPGAPFWVLSTG